MDLEKICMMFTMQEPYYGILLSSMERVPAPQKTATVGVGRAGNVFKLYYNSQFIGRLDIDETIQVLKHEVLHLAFNHFSIWDDDNPSPEVHRLRNCAADLEVNCYINTSVMKNLNPLVPSRFGWEKCAGTREYFNRLMKLLEQRRQQTPAEAGRKGGRYENGNEDDDKEDSDADTAAISEADGQFFSQFESFDDHTHWPDCTSDDEKEQMQQIVDDMLVFAADEVEKAHGTLPGEMVGRVERIRSRKKPRPVADWKRYFRRYLGNEFSEFIRKSKKRESRRFPDAAGNRHRRKSHILVAIDTSGSVSMPEYREFFGQIRTLTASADFHVVECDARIAYEYDYHGHPNETLHGGGGTDFQPVIDLFIRDRKKYDALVYFTDGHCDIPKNTPKDTLWVVSSQGDQSDRGKYRVNGASVTFIPKHDG